MTENKHIEFKQQITSDLEREVVAFLNSNEGGIIYIGIDKAGKPVGVKDIDYDQLLIKDKLKNNILPSCMGLFDLVTERHAENDVIKLIVAGGYEKPYYIKKYGLSEKGAFIRIGSSSEPMPTRQIEQLFSKRIRHSISNIKSSKEDLQFQQLHIYYQGIDKILSDQFAKNLALLTDDNSYNYVAYLLNDINTISVKVARYNGIDRADLIESNEYGFESIIKATQQVLDKLDLENRTFTKITSKERQEKRIWNELALREAVVNAFVHKAYTKELAPKFELFDNRLEITSNGGLPDGLSKDEFFEGFSIPRNKELMRVFKDLDLVEQLGSGVPRILKSYNMNVFHFSENFLRIVLPISISNSGGHVGGQAGGQELSEFMEVKQQFEILLNEVDNSTDENKSFIQHNYLTLIRNIELNFGITSGKLRESFGKTSDEEFCNEEITLILISLKSKITATEIAQFIGVSSRTSEKYIQKLREDNFINRLGGRKEGVWQIIKQDQIIG